MVLDTKYYCYFSLAVDNLGEVEIYMNNMEAVKLSSFF